MIKRYRIVSNQIQYNRYGQICNLPVATIKNFHHFHAQKKIAFMIYPDYFL